jgi:uncharacterized protein YbjT (DUF2867 family)
MILVTGATGNVGRQVVRELVELGRSVRAMSRDPGRAGLPDGVEVVRGDPADAASVTAALHGIDQVFVVLVGDVEAQALGFAAAARFASGPTHVVLLSSLAVTHPVSHQIQRQHAAAERIIAAADVSMTVLRPGPFHSNALWWANSIREKGKARCLVGNTPGAPVDPSDIAAVAVAALTRDDVAGRVHELTGPDVLTSGDQVRILAAILDRTIDFEVATVDEAVAMFASITHDRPTAETNVRALHSPAVPWRNVLRTVPDLLGRPARPFRDWAVMHAAAYH